MRACALRMQYLSDARVLMSAKHSSYNLLVYVSMCVWLSWCIYFCQGIRSIVVLCAMNAVYDWCLMQCVLLPAKYNNYQNQDRHVCTAFVRWPLPSKFTVWGESVCIVRIHSSFLTLISNHLHLHLPLNHEGHQGTTDDLTTSFFHFSLLSLFNQMLIIAFFLVILKKF